MLLTVPGKSGGGAGGAGGGASVNVVQQVPNKVVLRAPSPGAAGKTASTITGIAQVQSRGSTGTTAIIRTPGSATPAYTIRGPVPVTSQPTLAGSATTAIRLTSPSNPGGAGPVQFVPVSMAAGSTLRPAVASGAGPAVSFRPAVSSATINQRPPSASDNTNTTGVGNTVRVTLVQSSVAGGKPVVSQPNYYKPITITSGGVQPVVSATPVSRASPVVSAAVPVSSPAAAPVRIGTIPARAMVPIAAVSQPLAVSVTPASHISLPIQQNIISGKHGAPSLRFPASVSTSGKILQMPIVAGPAAAAATGQPSGVTIQKTTIPVGLLTERRPLFTDLVSTIKQPPEANSIPRTISLPYGTTTGPSTISAISAATPGGAAKGTTPRVMTSQPLATITSNSGNPGNLVTITSSISGGAGAGSVAEGVAALGSATAAGQTAGTAAALPAGSVYVARAPPGSTNPPLAINLTNTGPAKIISQSSRSGPLSLDSNPAGVTTSAQIITSSASTQGTGKGPTPAANLPIQPARFMALPVASSQGGSASGTASGQPATILTNLTAGQQQQQLLTTVANVVAAGGGGGEGGDKKGGNLLLTNSQINSAPSRPGILRRRDGDRDGAVSPTRGDLEREDDAGSSTSGSTTLSAASSPGGAVAAVAGGGSGPLSHPPGGMHVNDNGEAMDGDGSLNPSPRKKLRKQQFNTQPWMSDELAKNTVNNVGAAGNGQPGSPSRKRKMPSGSAGSPSGHYRHFGQPHPAQSGGMGQVAHPPPVFMEKPRFPPLINSYRHTWKSRHNHFLRHSDVKVKEDRRPTVNELANQRQVLQKIDGWKVYHLSTQMESMVETEVEFAKKLNALHKRLEKTAHPDLKDLGKVQELIKANLQRSKVVQDSVKEAKQHLTNEIFEHKDRVKDIVKKYVSKRQVKKRELS